MSSESFDVDNEEVQDQVHIGKAPNCFLLVDNFNGNGFHEECPSCLLLGYSALGAEHPQSAVGVQFIVQIVGKLSSIFST